MGERDGGAAFPIPEQRAFDGAGLVEGHPGMSLRDYFAAAVLPAVIGLVASGGASTQDGQPANESTFAQQAYAFADAMLAARTQGSE